MLGIVIVSYHSDDLTVRFVRGQLSAVRIPHRIVIVDNGVGEGKDSPLSRVLPETVVLTMDNKGFAAANNKGAGWLREHCPVNEILFTNNDIRMETKDVLELMSAKLNEDERIGMIGPEVVGLDGRRQSPEGYLSLWKRYVWMYLSTPFLSQKGKERLFGLKYAESAKEGSHYRLSGSFSMMRSEDFYRIGMMDEGTFLYAEENILSERLKRIGKVCYFYPAVRVVHEHSLTIDKSYDLTGKLKLQYASNAYCYRKYRNYPAIECRIVGWLFGIILYFKSLAVKKH